MTTCKLLRVCARARSDIAITSDLIVGFPGESDADFEATLQLMKQAQLADSFSFKYSPRPQTKAVEFGDEVPAEVAQERLQQLQALQRELSLDGHRARVGGTTEVLIEGSSRKGAGQYSGRDPYHRIVNFAFSPSQPDTTDKIGSTVVVEIVDATPHSLIGESHEANTGHFVEAGESVGLGGT